MNSLAYFSLIGCMLSAALGAVIVCLLVSGCGFAWSEGQPEDDRRRNRVTRVGHAAAGLSFFFAALFALVALAGASSDLPFRLHALRPPVPDITVTLGRIAEVAERLRTRLDQASMRPAAVDAPTRTERAIARSRANEPRLAQSSRPDRVEVLAPPRPSESKPPQSAPSVAAAVDVAPPVRSSTDPPEPGNAQRPARPGPDVRPGSTIVSRVQTVPTPEPIVPAVPAPNSVQLVEAEAPESSQPDDRARRIRTARRADWPPADRADGSAFRPGPPRFDEPDREARAERAEGRERAEDADRMDRRHETDRPEVVKPERTVRTETARLVDRADRFERPERIERIDRSNRVERVERPERVERVDRVERPERIERPERVERIERPERVERIERPEKVERIERVERASRIERPERRERAERLERSGRR